MRLLTLLAAISLAGLMLTGCWDLQEISELAPLTGLGGELALPILDLTPLRLQAGDHQAADGTGQQGQQLMEVVVGRTALFKRDRWVHELDVYQTQIFILLGETLPKAPSPASTLPHL